MKKRKEWPGKVLFSASWQHIAYCLCVVAALLLMAFFSQQVVFYAVDLSAAAYDMRIEKTQDISGGMPMDVSYEGNTIVLAIDGAADGEEIAVYASTRFGTAKLGAENMAHMDETFLGSFAAVYPKQSFDIDGDGKNENVFYSIKTDLREVQSSSGMTPLFRDGKIVMEIGMDSFERLFVYFQSRPLQEREVTVCLADGSSYQAVTDELGYIDSPSLNQIRAGIEIRYEPNGLNTYISRYVPEKYSVFSRAIVPLLILLLLAAGTIGFCVLLRHVFTRKVGKKDYSVVKQRGTSYKPAFVIVRWAVMLASFALLTWGGSRLGLWFENLYIPVLSCSKYNPEQLVGSA